MTMGIVLVACLAARIGDSKRPFAAPEMGFGDYARLPGIAAGKFTAGAEVERACDVRSDLSARSMNLIRWYERGYSR